MDVQFSVSSWLHIVMNNVMFTSRFRREVRAQTKSNVRFFIIPADMWKNPNHIEQARMQKGMERMRDRAPYWDSVSYRQMCRFNSGPFFQLSILAKYDWFWHLDDDVHYLCQLRYDPLGYMKENGIVYGFGMMFAETALTVPTLYPTAIGFVQSNPYLTKAHKQEQDKDWMDYLRTGHGDQYTIQWVPFLDEYGNGRLKFLSCVGVSKLFQSFGSSWWLLVHALGGCTSEGTWSGAIGQQEPGQFF
eukprot:Nk52_evm12s1763 gene=Nk52_evmTU12s1763